MREIKFRAWFDGKMIYQPELEWAKCADRYIIRLLDDSDFHECIATTIFDDNFNLMQYTGLKDKNGKEIYEGDILERTNGLLPFIVKWDNESAAFVSFVFHAPVEVLREVDTEHRIIGNVYENPELVNAPA